MRMCFRWSVSLLCSQHRQADHFSSSLVSLQGRILVENISLLLITILVSNLTCFGWLISFSIERDGMPSLSDWWSMNISHLFSSSFTGYQSNSASNLRSYCWYTRRSTDLHLSTSRSCSCLINPDAIYDQKLRAFWMSLGLDSNLEIALSPLVHRDYGMRCHNTWRILHRVRPSRSVSKHTFSGSPIEALLTMTQTMTMCSAFEHLMNGKGAI